MDKKIPEPDKLYLESLVATLTGWNDPEARLTRAFEEDEFILFGQPIVPLDPKSDLPPRVEVLIRLREEERNLTPPGAFIPFLEYFDMMPLLDRWVIGHALDWWRSTGNAQKPVLSVNLSAITLGEPGFPEYVGRLLIDRKAPGQALCFELAHGDLTADPALYSKAARQLKSLGCSFAVTGLGSDSVSFQTLRTIPASLVKIDGAIIREIHRDTLALAKAKSLRQVCQKLGIHSVAEFVELPETRRLLHEIGVDYAQGYGIVRPSPLK